VSLSLAAEDRIQLWRRLVEALLEGDIVLRRLAAVLAQTDSSLAATYGILEPLLLQTVQPVQTEQSDVVGLSGMELDLPTEDMDVQGRLDTMEERLLAMEKIRARRSSSATVPQQHSMLGNGGDGANAVGVGVGVGVPGWRKLGNTEWRACPIGVWGGV
jgi:ribosomal biogenesis protein LAS1